MYASAISEKIKKPVKMKHFVGPSKFHFCDGYKCQT